MLGSVRLVNMPVIEGAPKADCKKNRMIRPEQATIVEVHRPSQAEIELTGEAPGVAIHADMGCRPKQPSPVRGDSGERRFGDEGLELCFRIYIGAVLHLSTKNRDVVS